MDIIVKGRHTDVDERFRRQAGSKLAKIEKLDHKLIRADVEVSKEHNPRQSNRRERVELTIRSRGPVIRAEAAAEERYAALDLAVTKLESRLRRMKDRRKVHYGSHTPTKLATAVAPPRAGGAGERTLPGGGAGGADAAGGADSREAAEGPGAGRARGRSGDREAGAVTAAAEAESAGSGGDEVVPEEAYEGADESIVPIPMEGDGPLVVREKCHRAQPMAIDQALHEMELVGHDFFLFRDVGSGHPCVVYRRRGWDYGVIRLIEE
jgi:ribosomal subunit interface protein